LQTTVSASDIFATASNAPTTQLPADQHASVASPGSVLLPGYEILEELGRGGMGVVYKARHLGLKRLVALKMILSAEHAGAEERARFHAEAEAIAKLHHPNIVQVYDIGEANGKPFFALEYVAGGSLSARVRGEPQPPRDAAQIIEVLARAMDAAHRKGIVHRDLKPANILLMKLTTEHKEDTEKNKKEFSSVLSVSSVVSFSPKITDFGLAKTLDDDAGRTRTGAVMGTPSYMSPEQAGGDTHAIGPATDVYALGAILYELLTGRPPFRGASVLDTLDLVRTQEPVAPGRLVARLPRDLETICLKCLEKDPVRRYPAAAALADDLRRYLDERPILARPVGRWEQLRKFTRRNRLLVGSAVAVSLVLVVGIIGTSLGMARARQAEGVALENLGRAIEAERNVRLELARSHWDNGRLAAGHGRWREAIAMFDQALAAGFEDDIGVRLEKVKALLAIHEATQADQEIATLARRPDLGNRESVLLLLRGDRAMAEWSGKERALADVRRALEIGLPPDDQAYAQALLAEWPQDAAQYLRRALALNPSHSDARQLLFPILMSLGRLEECKQEANTLLAFFPEDPSPRVYLAVVYLAEGDLPSARARIQETESQLGKERTAVLLDMMEVFHSALEAAAASDQPNVPVTLVPRLQAVIAKFQGQFDAQGPTTLDVHAVNMPCLTRVWKPLYTALLASSLGSFSDAMTAQLDEVVAHHPEGVAYFLHATSIIAQAAKQKGPAMLPLLRKAEPSFRKAMDGPCTIPAMRRLARFWGTYLQAILAKPNSTAGPPDLEMRARAAANMRRLLADGKLSPTNWSTLTELALTRLEDCDLARLLAAAGDRQAPGDVRFLRWRAQIELTAGAYHPALDAAAKVLAKEPKDAEALRVRKEATQKLRGNLR
jgi:serine/threonine protein kinase/Flp pilus assembly protein TadD